MRCKIKYENTEWDRNIQKRRKAEGRSYVDTTKEGNMVVHGKQFSGITTYCQKL